MFLWESNRSTALKTLALRLRGAKVELEEAGLETDAMAESTSTLQAKLLALTHGKVDIMLDEETFKSTTQILREMADAWEDMTDIEAASALELMGGKRQANILASVIKNFDVVEDVINTSMNSEGSALIENEKHLDSIHGKIEKLTNSMQTMWMNFMKADVVKFLMDVANAFVNIADGAGLLNSAVALLFAKSALSADSFGQFFKFDTSLDDTAKGINRLSFSLAGATKNAKGLSIGMKAAAVGTQLLNAALTMGASLLIGHIIEKSIGLIDSLIVTTEEAIEKASELRSAYQQETETIQSNVTTLQSLESEFETLSRGVDDYGNNISLAADDYARYQEIVATILGMSPSLIQGYNAEGEAIANKNGLLQKSIDLMNAEQRIKAKEFVTDENLQTMLVEAKSTLDEAIEKGIPTELSYSGIKIVDGKEKTGFVNQIDEYISRAIGVEYDGNGIGEFIANNAQLVRDNIGDILNIAREGFTDDDGAIWKGLDEDKISSLKDYITSIINAANEASRQMNETLQLVPQSLTSYYNLTPQMQGFLSQYINSFVVTANTTEEEILAMKEEIKSFTDFLANDEDLQQTISIGFTLKTGKDSDGNGLSVKEYNEQKAQFIKNIQDTYDDDKESVILSTLGFDTDESTIDNDIEKAIVHAMNLLKDEYDSSIDGMSLSDIQIAYKISSEPNSMTFEELRAAIDQIKKNNGADVVGVKTYTILVSDVEAYNEALQQTSEIYANNTEITQEYKDSLLQLGISEEELNECFYDSNQLVVKNSEHLNKLVKDAKKNTAQNIKLAKSQAQLQYYELYKELSDYTKGTKAADAETLAHINSLYSEMSAIQTTIAKFSMLEAQLLGVTNAYDKLAEAQELDAAMDYGSKAEELVNILGQAFNTSELGTQAAQVAISGLIPQSVFDDANDLDDKMQKIYDYFTTGEMSKLFTIEFDDDGGISSVEMTKENVKQYAESLFNQDYVDGAGKNLGAIFKGTWDEFTLNEEIKTLDDFAKACGVTKEVAFAFLTELEKYDINWLGGDKSTLLDQLMGDDLDYKIYDVTQKMAELDHQVANGKITAEEYNKAMNEAADGEKSLSEQSEELKKKAKTEVETWQQKTDALQEQKTLLSSYYNELKQYKQLEDGTWQKQDNSGAWVDATKDVEELKKKIKEAEGETNTLSAELAALGVPTQIVLQFVKDDIEAELDDLESKLNKKYTVEIEGEVELGEDGKYVFKKGTSVNTQGNDEQNYLELKNLGLSIDNLMKSTLSPTEASLSNIESILSNIHSILSEKEQTEDKTAGGSNEKNDSLNLGLGPVSDQFVDKLTSVGATDSGGGIAGVAGSGYQDPMYLSGPKTNLLKTEAEQVLIDGKTTMEAAEVNVGTDAGSGVHTSSSGTPVGGGAGESFETSYTPPETISGPIDTTLNVDTSGAEAQIDEAGAKVDDAFTADLNVETSLDGGEDPLGINKANADIGTLGQSLYNLGISYKTGIGKWFDGKTEISFSVESLVDTLSAQGWTSEAIQAYCQQLSGAAVDGVVINVEGLDTVDAYLSELDSKEISDKTADVDVKGAQEAQDELEAVDAAAGNVTKTVTVITRNMTVSNGGGGIGSNQTYAAKAHGTAYKSGSWGAEKTETALVGELGPELVSL